MRASALFRRSIVRTLMVVPEGISGAFWANDELMNSAVANAERSANRRFKETMFRLTV
jgi:hypothetical protein